MSPDSRQLDTSSDRFAEQLSALDAGMQIQRPEIDWSKVVAKRQARRRIAISMTGSVAVLCFIALVARFANQLSQSNSGGDLVKPDIATIDNIRRARAERELVALDRELMQLDRRIASINRRERHRKANMKVAKLQKNPPQKIDFSDPVEEGALVMLAAAEKAVQKDGRDAGTLLYRRIVEIFPETRCAEIARRQLM